MAIPAFADTMIGADVAAVLLLQLAAILVAAVLLGRAAQRLGSPAVVGELAAGVVLGPSLLGTLAPGVYDRLFPADAAQWNLLDAVGQIGVVLLVGLGTMELDTLFLRRRVREVTSVSGFSFLLPFALGLAAGVGVWHLLGLEHTSTWLFALFMGTALSVSAIPVIVKTLNDLGLLKRDIGQLILACGMTNDAVGWTLLSVISSLALAGSVSGEVPVVIAVTISAVALVLMVLRPLVRRVFERMEAGTWRGSVAPVVVLVIFAAAATAQMVDLEASFGAFLAGLMIGRREMGLTAPVRSFTNTVLAPVFLALAGLRMDLTELADMRVLAAAALVLAAAFIGKFVGAFVGARLVSMANWEAATLGAGLNARGVVEVVVAMVGLQIGVLDSSTYTVVVLVAVTTSIAAPIILRMTARRIPVTNGEDVRMRERSLEIVHDGA